MNLRHYFTHFSSLGGVQSILGAHLKYDELAGLNPSLLAFFDPTHSDLTNTKVSGLNWTGKTSIHTARLSFKNSESGKVHDCCIYHDLWGLAFLADLDHCHHRIGAIHSHWPHLEHQLNQLDGFLDGVFCDSQALADIAMEAIPSLKPDRAIHLPVPIKTCPAPFRMKREPMHDRALRLGFVGRLDHLQKRVERFIPLAKYLDQRGFEYELEFLGDGTARPALETAFRGKNNIQLHGKQSGNAYWHILGKWDFVIYTSDFEGSPLAMQEALNAGCIPIFPKIKCGGDLVVSHIDRGLLYDPEDYASIADTLSHWKTLPNAQVEKARRQGVQISSEYAADKYHEKFRTFLEHILSMPIISKHPVPQRARAWKDRLPFGMLRRWFPKSFFAYQAKK